MRELFDSLCVSIGRYCVSRGIGMRVKLVALFVTVKVLSLVLLVSLAWNQFSAIAGHLRDLASTDVFDSLNTQATESIESLTTDIANEVASFLYDRDGDIRMLASLNPSVENFSIFAKKTRRIVKNGRWDLADDGMSWVRTDHDVAKVMSATSTNKENNDNGSFHTRLPESFSYMDVPLYDEITFVDLNGNELVKVVTDSTKRRYPMDRTRRNISDKKNTYVKAEDYFEHLTRLKPGEIYVSDVVGAYVPSNYIGMYAPNVIKEAEERLGHEIPYDPEAQAYAGRENPNGLRFEGIVRWAMPVTSDEGRKIGYVTFALNHDHIMEFVDHRVPDGGSFIDVPSAYEGNYAFIWDHKCRSICHPRHHSIYGFDPETGDPQVPWLEESIYQAWKESGVEKWTDFIRESSWPEFDEQSRGKRPAPELTRSGMVGLDGRWLNFAPQCTGWMDLTKNGGSGSFNILWSGIYKLTTAAAIPYYTGQYAPSEENGWSRRGFGIVTIGSGLDDFRLVAEATERKVNKEINTQMDAMFTQLMGSASLLIVLVVVVSFLTANWINDRISDIIKGIERYRRGEMHFRFRPLVMDEFGMISGAFDEMANSIRDNFKNPMTITDLDHNIIFVNDSALALIGASIEEVVGRRYEDLSIYPHDTKYDPIKALEDDHETSIYHVEALDLYLKPTAHYTFDSNGDRHGFFIESINVTDMQKMQNELEDAMNRANAANRHKSEFLARMSHEFRTPMNAIVGLTSIVHKMLGEVKDRANEIKPIDDHVLMIESSSKYLLSLLNDVLDISKYDTDKIDIDPVPCSMGKLIDAIEGIVKTNCEEKDITYTSDCDDLGYEMYEFDPQRLRQALNSLLSNAVKFTLEGGSVHFSMHKTGERDGEVLFEFSVRDTGIGIEPESLEKIFLPFEQANDKIARQFGGTGLGLTISQSIVEQMGGSIEVESEPGKGSVFSFRVWIKKVDEEAPIEMTVEDIEGKLVGKKLLLVDDVDINRMIVATILEDTGIEIDEASDGSEALAMFEKSEAGEYSLVLMDIQMPNMDGYEASLSIRALDRPDAASVPIVALSANAFKDDIQKSLESKMDAHIAKPVDETSLVEILVKYILNRKDQ